VPPAWVTIGLAGILLSIALLGFGVPMYRRRHELKGWLGLLMLLLGVVGLLGSVWWLFVQSLIHSE
jgi:hypothetical protein